VNPHPICDDLERDDELFMPEPPNGNGHTYAWEGLGLGESGGRAEKKAGAAFVLYGEAGRSWPVRSRGRHYSPPFSV
jgi:hypothetical protein